MKKIGILTQPINSNYGGILQNYALQTILIRMGFEVETLNWDSYRCEHDHESIWSYIIKFSKTFISKYIFRRKRNFFWKERKYFYILSSNNSSFCEKYIKKSTWLWGKKQFRDYAIKKHFDILLVGSDQTWRPAYNKNGMLYRMFLDFAEHLNVKRIAYSASFGVDEWEYTDDQTRVCSRLLHKFDSISVREDSGVVLCKNYFNINDVICTLDPTLLLDQKDYTNLIKQIGTPSTESEGDILVYMLDYSLEKERMISTLSRKKGLKCSKFISRYCNLGTVDIKEINNYISPSCDVWLNAFLKTKYVVCDSFHGMVFSIIFNKPFIVIKNRNRGLTRFISLLSRLNLQNRLIEDTSEDYINVIDTPIDWKKVNELITQMRKESINYLKHSLDI